MALSSLVVPGTLTSQKGAFFYDSVSIAGPVVVDDLIRTNSPHGIVCGGELHVAQDVTVQETLSVFGLASLSGGSACGVKTVDTASSTLGPSDSGKVILCGSASRTVRLSSGMPLGATLTFVVPSRGAVRRIIPSASGSITFISNDATGETTTISGDSVSFGTLGAGTLVLAQTAPESWFVVSRAGPWTVG